MWDITKAGIEPMHPALAGRFLTPGPPGMSLCLTFNSFITQLCIISRFKNLILPVSVQFSCSVVSDSLPPHGLQHARLPCPSPTARACSNSCLEPAQTHVHRDSDAIQPSHPLSSPSSPALIFPIIRVFSVSQLFASVAKVMELQLQHQSFQ